MVYPQQFSSSLLRLTVAEVDADAAAAAAAAAAADADADRLRCLLCRPGQHGHTK